MRFEPEVSLALMNLLLRDLPKMSTWQKPEFLVFQNQNFWVFLNIGKSEEKGQIQSNNVQCS